MALNSKIILCKDILMDREYKNVINYSESQMLALCNSKAVASASDYSFVPKISNTIDVGFTYSDCLNANYIAFQNPNYSNKWFFGFLTNIEFRSPSMTRLTYQIDEFSTWYDYWDPKQCFVIREHVSDDTVGAHTVPENLELGEYIGNGDIVRDTILNDYSFMIQVSEWYTSETKLNSTNIGGIPQAGGFYVTSSRSQLANIIAGYNEAGKIDAVKNVYIVPSAIVNNSSGSLQYSGQETSATHNFQITRPNSLDGYTPTNKKLLTYPYQYLILSNNNGSTNILQYENFDTTTCSFQVSGIPVMGSSISCYPRLYKGHALSYDDGLIAGKFPTLSWSSDNYTNWLRQNSINIGTGFASEALQLVGGIGLILSGSGAPAGALMLANTGVSVANSIGQIYQHSLVPNSVKGNQNAGDILTSNLANTFMLERMSIKSEYAKIIDSYFNRFGYKINRIKIPNQTSRQNWNYVQIGNSECIGYSNNKDISVPPNSISIINQIFRNGVTIWHNHSNLGNYSLTNNIIN